MFEVKISDQAYYDIDIQLEYIQRKYNNYQAIENILTDIAEIKQLLSENPNVFSDYSIADYKKAHLKKHNYKLIYSINEDVGQVCIHRFIHDLQDTNY